MKFISIQIFTTSINGLSCAVLNLLENFAFLCVCNSNRSIHFWVVGYLANIFPKFLTDTSKNEKKIHTNKFSR